MKDSQSLFEHFLESLNDFPQTDLEMHSALLSDLSGSRIYWKCSKLQTKKCLQVEGCLEILDQMLKSNNQSSIFLFKYVFHAVRDTADLKKVFEYFVDAVIKSNSKFSTHQLQNFDEFLGFFVTSDSKFDLVIEKADKQFLRSPESILKGIYIS
jgi:hypothetical protein